MEKDQKTKYKKDFLEVQKLVNEFDPCNFISAGAPVDEYDYLTNQLVSALYNGKSRNEIRELILHEINNHFGTSNFKMLQEPFKSYLFNDLNTFLLKIENLQEP